MLERRSQICHNTACYLQNLIHFKQNITILLLSSLYIYSNHHPNKLTNLIYYSSLLIHTPTFFFLGLSFIHIPNMSFNMFNVVYVDTSSESSHVQTFHSTAKWNDHFDAIKETDKLMVIDFTAKWCGPCKLMDPTMNDFAAKYTDVEFIKLDVDELMGVSQTFQVYSLPTFLLVKKGKIIDKVVGVRKEELQKMIEKHIN